MAVRRIDHLGIAVESLDEALQAYTAGLGLELAGREEVEEQGVRVAMLPTEAGRIELLEPTRPDSPIARFLATRGPGLHHVALEVEDIHKALEQAQAAGLRLIDATPRRGAGGSLVAFIHPKSLGGVLVEFVEPAGREA